MNGIQNTTPLNLSPSLTVFDSKENKAQKKNVTLYPAIEIKVPNLSPMLSPVTGTWRISSIGKWISALTKIVYDTEVATPRRT
jgi:hypothetical protein